MYLAEEVLVRQYGGEIFALMDDKTPALREEEELRGYGPPGTRTRTNYFPERGRAGDLCVLRLRGTPWPHGICSERRGLDPRLHFEYRQISALCFLDH